MVLGFRRFLVRSPQRDKQRDDERFDPIEAALVGAIRSASNEHDGLKRRVDERLMAVAHAIDDTGDYQDRDPNDEQRIVELEQAIGAGQKRVETLRTQAEKLDEVLRLVRALRERLT